MMNFRKSVNFFDIFKKYSNLYKKNLRNFLENYLEILRKIHQSNYKSFSQFNFLYLTFAMLIIFIKIFINI